MNINWLMVSPEGATGRAVMGDVPTLAEVQAGMASWYDFSQDANLASPQVKARKVFPTVLAAYVDEANVLERSAFPQTIN